MSYSEQLRSFIAANPRGMFREPKGQLKHGFLVPGAAHYGDELWDWDSWFANVALRQIALSSQDAELSEELEGYERGCVLNFLSKRDIRGWVPVMMTPTTQTPCGDDFEWRTMHKPCLAQHAAFIVKTGAGDAEWLRDHFSYLQAFVDCYLNHHRNKPTGLLFWIFDIGLGVDNDPCTWNRPPRSSGSIFLNCLMVQELEAIAYLADCLNLDEIAQHYRKDKQRLVSAIREHCWDPWLGFYYSVDLNLKEPDAGNEWGPHYGMPSSYDCLIQRVGVWSGFLAMWSGVATAEQAERMVLVHYRNVDTFNCPSGIRTLSRLEKMYCLKASGNPSSWLGPVWGISNYLVFRGLVRYGYESDARELAERTIRLFGRDVERFGALHEYYQPENGEPILNRGFQNWNFLVLNMIEYLEEGEVIWEF
nr:trehalase family glycosidase [Pelagicoccus enzymogenes]